MGAFCGVSRVSDGEVFRVIMGESVGSVIGVFGVSNRVSVEYLIRRQEAEKIEEREDLEHSQPVHIAKQNKTTLKNEKVCSGENTKGMGGRSLLKRDYGYDSLI